MDSVNQFPFAYICPHCGKYAFYYKKLPKKGETVRAADTFYKDGTQPEVGYVVKCGTCERPINELLLCNVVDSPMKI